MDMIYISLVLLAFIICIVVVYSAMMERQKSSVSNLKNRRIELKAEITDLQERLSLVKMQEEAVYFKLSRLQKEAEEADVDDAGNTAPGSSGLDNPTGAA